MNPYVCLAAGEALDLERFEPAMRGKYLQMHPYRRHS
jgi:hypothetical protein